MRFPSLLAVVVAAVSLACRSGSQAPARGLSAASTTPPSSLLRLPAAGGAAELYRPATMAPWGWKSDASLPPLRRVVGPDLDLGLVYLLGTRNELVALDLLSARPRPVLASGIRDIAMGPDRTVYAVDDSLRVTQFVRRNPVRFSSRLPARPRDLFGTRNAGLLTVSAGAANALTLLYPEDPPTRTLLPTGDVASTYWGDLLAVAADSAVLLADPEDTTATMSIPVSGHARAVLFSPSGHRFYVARRTGSVLVYSRFTRERVAQIDLPGSAGALRADPYGRWLMVHPAAADSLWLVDMATNRFMGSFAAEWGADLPTITNQQLLLVRDGRDVVAWDLAQGDFPERGRVRGGAADLWLPLAWTPETGTASALVEAPVPEAVEPDAATAGPRSTVYLQVSSSQNQSWAAELARQLSQQGLPASVLDPRAGEDGYRVVLGPYPSREAAESTGRRLGRPFFVYQPDR